MLKVSSFMPILLVHLIAISCVCCTTVVSGQDGHRSQINLKFFDVSNGMAVFPEKLTFLNDQGQVLNVQENYFQNKNEANIISYNGPIGAYTIFIEDQQYEASLRRLNILEKEDIYHIYLRPNNIHTKLTSGGIKALLRSDKMLINGFITDDYGKALGDAEIWIKNRRVSSSNQSGYFEFYFGIEQGVSDQVELRFRKHDFVEVRRKITSVWSKGFWTYSIQMHSTINSNTITNDPVYISSIENKNAYIFKSNRASCILPTDIRVGTSCTPDGPRDSCDGPVISLTLEDYIKNVLPNEWFVTWASNTAGMGGEESLKAGTVAIRSYASWFVLVQNAGSNYDICSSTTCQFFQMGTDHPVSNAIVDLMEGYHIVSTSGTIIQAEYARETNQAPSGNGQDCPNGFFASPLHGICNGCGSGSNDVCFGVPVDTGSHNRGMCQRGSVRWATGLSYPTNSNPGSPHGKGTKNWQDILAYYYCFNEVLDQCATSCPETLVLDGNVNSGLYEASNYVEAKGIINNGEHVTITGGNYVEWTTGFDGASGSIVIGEVSDCIN